MDNEKRNEVCKAVAAHIIEVREKGYKDKKLEEIVDKIDELFIKNLSEGNYRYDAFIDSSKENTIDEDEESLVSILDFDKLLKGTVVIESRVILDFDILEDETGALMTVGDTENIEIAIEDKLNERYNMDDVGSFCIGLEPIGDSHLCVHINIRRI